jgi:ribosomal protein S27AE
VVERTCSVKGCTKRHHGRGFCSNHLERARRAGTLPPVQPSMDSLSRHSLSNIDRENKTADCSVCGPSVKVRLHKDRYRGAECWTPRNARKKKHQRKNHLSSAYGLTLAQFEEMRALQMGRCAICASTPARFDVDHDHDTGKVRGLLCSPCNRGLGFFRDRRENLAAAAKYLGLHSPD